MGQGAASDPIVKFALAGFKDGRERLTRGIYTCRGSKIDKQQVGTLTGTLDIFAAFDFPKGLSRFDRTETQRIFEHDRSGKTGQRWKPGPEGGKQADTPEHSIQFILG